MWVRMERRGKSSPACRELYGYVNPIRCNTDKDGFVGPTVLKGGTEHIAATLCQDRLPQKQNPAYRFGRIFDRKQAASLDAACFCFACFPAAVRNNRTCESIDSYLTFFEFLRANCDKNMAVFIACCSIFTSFMGTKSGFLHKSTKCLYRGFTHKNECAIITVIY